MAIIGSSYYRPIDCGVTAGGTGPTGPAGPAGPTGPTGEGPTGPTGNTGDAIISMYVTGGKLLTIFEREDGTTFDYITPTDIFGPTGGYKLYIDGKNVGVGATVFATRPEYNEITLRSIKIIGEGASADYLTLTQDSLLNTINIHYDIGESGYFNAVLGSTGQLGGFTGDPISFYGITGTTYDQYQNAINVSVRDFKERSKYLTVIEADEQNAGTADFYQVNPGADVHYEGYINPDEAKLFKLDMSQLSGVLLNGATAAVVNIQDAGFGYTGNNISGYNKISKAFTLIVNYATNAKNYDYRFTNVIWPFKKQPCFSGGTDIFNFFWLPCTPEDMDGDEVYEFCPNGYSWYGNVVQWESSSAKGVTLAFECNQNSGGYMSMPAGVGGRNSRYRENVMDYPGIEKNEFGITGSTGACCLGDDVCVHTTENLCYGYYFGNGSTCGSTFGGGITGSCYSEGPCCVHYQDIDQVKCFENLSVNECISLRKLLKVSTVFGGSGGSCEEIDCSMSSKGVGACCAGNGMCEYLTNEDCRNKNGTFLGAGVPCVSYNGIEMCSGGTGACCSGSTCSIMSGENCLSNAGYYAGHGISCDQIKCHTNIGNMDYEVSSLDLQPGDLFAGGMVVGLYRPMNSWLVGSNSFGKSQFSDWDELMIGAVGSTADVGLNCGRYRSKYDHHGYGCTSDGPCPKQSMENIDDAYYIITSLSPISITGDREVVNVIDVPDAETEFYWGNYGSSWGPIYNQNTHKYDDLNSEYKEKFKIREGYWYNESVGNTSLNNIPINTFNSCVSARVFGSGGIEKTLYSPNQTAHGFWKRNWGLYNNIRAISADNALYMKYTDSNDNYTPAQFGPLLSPPNISAFRAVRLFDDALSGTGGDSGSIGGNPPGVSSWYIPSHDELSFIAANCITKSPYGFNLNSHLIANEKGVPFDDWYWSSTGAFDETKGFTAGVGEGIVSGTQLTNTKPGSLSWAIKFDVNGNRQDFLDGKKNRTETKHQIRPIRIIRLDGKNSINKLWDLPKVLRDSDKGINQ